MSDIYEAYQSPEELKREIEAQRVEILRLVQTLDEARTEINWQLNFPTVTRPEPGLLLRIDQALATYDTEKEHHAGLTSGPQAGDRVGQGSSHQ